MKRTIVAALAGSMILGGCAQNPSHEDYGRVMGAVIGGVAGSKVGEGKGKTAAIIAGTLAGAYIGGAIGKNMDETDRLKASQALETSRTYQPVSWHNPDSGASYTVTPTRTYQANSGSYCREYTTEAVIGGKRETVYGTACRQPDGSWQQVGN